MPYPDNVLRLPILSDVHRLVFVSGRTDLPTGRPKQHAVEPIVSFIYVDGDWAAEWETRYGPITIHHRAELADGEEPAGLRSLVPGALAG